MDDRDEGGVPSANNERGEALKSLPPAMSDSMLMF